MGRAQRLAAHPQRRSLLAAACGRGFAVVDLAVPAIVAVPSPADLHGAAVRALAFVPGPGGDGLLVTVGDDKEARLWRANGGAAQLLGSKRLVKRANALAVVAAADPAWADTPADAENDASPVVLIADKFGDVYRLSLNDIRRPSHVLPQTRVKVLAGDEEGAANLAMGHVSMLTDIALDPARGLVFTADRDEHIRITSYPKMYNIHGYLLGHEQFVSNIQIVPHSPRHLVSGGGDPFLILWDTERQRPVAKLDLSDIVEARGGLVSAAEATAKAAGLEKAQLRPAFHNRRHQKKGPAGAGGPEEPTEGDAAAEAPAEDLAADGRDKLSVARIAVSGDGHAAVLLENFPHALVYPPLPAGAGLPLGEPAVIDLGGIQPVDAAFDGDLRLWIAMLEGPPLTLWKLGAAGNAWEPVLADPVLDLASKAVADVPDAPANGAKATPETAVDFFPFGKIRKTMGEESGDEGGEDFGEPQQGGGRKKRAKR